MGPNAVIQLAAALEARKGADMADRVFAVAGLALYRHHPPEGMIPQSEAVAAHHAAFGLLNPQEAEAVAFDAGLRTGDYLLSHRIPAWVQPVLRRLPARLSARLLMRAIRANAWTFAGSGKVSTRLLPSGAAQIAIAANPLATDPCAWHRGVFQRLFERLVSPLAYCVETACVLTDAPACCFEISWR